MYFKCSHNHCNMPQLGQIACAQTSIPVTFLVLAPDPLGRAQPLLRYNSCFDFFFNSQWGDIIQVTHFTRMGFLRCENFPDSRHAQRPFIGINLLSLGVIGYSIDWQSY